MFRKVVVGLLIASCSLGSFPAGVGAYQTTRMREQLASALAGQALAQEDMAAMLEQANTPLDANAGRCASTPSLSSNVENGGYPQSKVETLDEGGSTAGEVSAADAPSKSEPTADDAPEAGQAQQDQNATGGQGTTQGQADGQSSTEGTVDGAAGEGAESDAEQDAAAIEGAEVLQQGDGETTGNVLVADRAAVEALGGRDYVGQTVKEINGTKYILIGNEQQLRAIGSDKHVVGKVFSRTEVLGIPGQWKLEYAGDADIDASDELSDTSYGDSLIIGKEYCGVDASGNMNEKASPNTGLKYSSDANYIIFRDIDVSNTAWGPLMFSGTMLGSKAADTAVKGNLWENFDASATDGLKADANRPVISGVRVHQTGKLDISKHQGVGFFGTISNGVNVNNIGVSAGEVLVKNVALDDIDVVNESVQTKEPTSLIGGLTGLLGGILGGVLGFLLPGLGLDDALNGLLTTRSKDPTTFATGAFAGRIIGDVRVEGCVVTGATVKNAPEADIPTSSPYTGITGGFVGYMAGEVEYDGLSEALGFTEKALEALLNVLPGIGLGDLIQILLENVVDVGKLIPTGYYNAKIIDSSLGLKANAPAIGSARAQGAGGFVGVQVGSIIESSEITTPASIEASEFGGGFAGVERNGQLVGALDKVGVDLLTQLGELIKKTKTQSLLLDCKLMQGATVRAKQYAGGISGVMANSYVVNCAAEGLVNVEATTSDVGGVAGAALLGWGTSIGEKQDHTLLNSVTDLLGKLTGENADVASSGLLALTGIEPSVIAGVQLSNVDSVSAGESYAGGIVGRGEATRIGSSNNEMLGEMVYWSVGSQLPKPAEQNVVALVSRVSATKDYAGGVAGELGPGNVAGLLNTTIGVGDVKMFWIKDVALAGTANGLTVHAGGSYAGGAVGCASGGKIANVTVDKLASVDAATYAGGFAGFSGPADAVGSGGINLLGIIKISGLLSIAQYSALHIVSSSVEGIEEGYTVKAAGADGNAIAGGFFGQANSSLVADCHARRIKSVTVPKEEGKGTAGGFVGLSVTGGLADALADDAGGNGGLDGLLHDVIKIENLLGAVPYLIPKYWGVDASYVNGGMVSGSVAGGFAGDFQSGKLNQFGKDDMESLVKLLGEASANAIKADVEQGPWAVINIAEVDGVLYAGGFGGMVRSGSLANASEGGIQILGKLGGTLNISQLLDVVQAYVPYVSYAGVHSDDATGSGGFIVCATDTSDADANAGSAGGWVGWGSAMQVSTCSVDELKHTSVVAPKDLEATTAESYYTEASSYGVDAPRNAGGWAGKIDVGSTAAAGSGLGLLGQSIALTDLLSALNVMVSTVEHSDVAGAIGGLSVRANGTAKTAEGVKPIGHAGGFAGVLAGGHVQDSNVSEFDYVVGRESAGGYAGTMTPGDVASVLGKENAASIINNLINVDSLLSLVQDFVPTVRNSYTECVPCGGAVRAEAEASGSTQRGCAGGYVGMLDGGHIWGNDTRAWKDVSVGASYSGDQNVAAARRIRSVFGTEFAGGYVGLMKPSDTASAGGLSLLGGLIKAGNLVSTLSMVYPTTENTEVSGPLRGIDIATFESWVEHVSKYDAYGQEFTDIIEKLKDKAITTQDQLDTALAKYVFGYNVVAGRASYGNGSLEHAGGMAGGYVGLMRTGTVSNGQAYDTKLVRAMRAAGGFAGGIEAGSAASIGDVTLFDKINVDLGALLKTPQVFVPVVKSSSAHGFRSGLTVRSTGTELNHGMGYAGGYTGYALGAQIWGDSALAGQDPSGCNVLNLRRVAGTSAVGGFVGRASGGSVASVDTEVSDGLIQSLLDGLIGSPGQLVDALKATVTTIRGAHVSAAAEPGSAEAAWGFTVEGEYRDGDTTKYATSAGGFAGSLEASVLGSIEGDLDDSTQQLSVNGLRAVEGGAYAGGFFGLGDVGGVASVGGQGADAQSGTTLLELIKLGNVDVLDAFRTFIYHAHVNGVSDGIRVEAHEQTSEGTGDEKRYTGTAGGFGGTLLNGSIKDCSVERLNAVTGLNYAGGFVGHLGKSGTVDVDEADAGVGNILKLLGATAGVLDIWGSHVERCTVDGIDAGYTVASTHGAPITSDAASEQLDGQEMAAGFVGFADMAKIDDCHVTDLKKVTSGQIAGGFVGKTTMGFVADIDAGSPVLLESLLLIVNALVKLLYLSDLQDKLGLLNIKIPDIIDLKVLSEGNTLYVNLLGLRIGVALSKKQDSSDPNATDVAVITIGDSTISLPCNEKGLVGEDDGLKSNLKVTLIKGNRTNITNNSVTGVASGYDVYGGGATDTSNGFGIGRYDDGRGALGGYAGGFVGLSNESVLDKNKMAYCDVVRGKGHDGQNAGGGTITGPFTGMTYLKTTYEQLNEKKKIETGNFYSIYRGANDKLTEALKGAGESVFADMVSDDAAVGGGAFGLDMNRYDVAVRESKGISEFDELQGAVESGTGAQRKLDAYQENGAKAVLMRDTPQTDNGAGLTPEPGDGQDPCSETVDLTLQKVWDDLGNRDQTRPNAVNFYISATYTDANGQSVVQWVAPVAGGGYGLVAQKTAVKLTAADLSPHSETWRRVLTDLPVAFEDKNSNPAAVRYYTYQVEEVSIDGYSVVYDVDATERVITVTNVYRPMLPETGGVGTWLTVLAGGMLLACAAYERRRRSMAYAGYVPAHFAPSRPRLEPMRPRRLRARGARQQITRGGSGRAPR